MSWRKKGDSPVSSILSADGHIVCTVAPREADRLSILVLNFGNPGCKDFQKYTLDKTL